MKRIILVLLLLPIFAQAITPVFTCGFECGATGAHFSLSGTTSFSTSTVRNGSRSVRANPTGASGARIQKSLPSPANTRIFRFGIYFATLPSTTVELASFNAGNFIGLYFKSSDSKLYAGVSTSSLGATGVSVTTGVWYYVDMYINSSANPWTVDVQVNGSACGQATAAQGATNLNDFELGNIVTSTTMDVFFDDFIVSNTGGDYPIGDGYVNHFIPTSDGTHAANITTNDFERTLTGTDILNNTTDAYQLIDDVPLESGSSVDWINMIAPVASSYTEHIFGPASGISTPTVAPRMVSVVIGIHAAGTGAYNAEWLLNDNGSTSSIFTASAVAGTTTVIYKNLDLADPPSAASAWTLSGNGNFNNIRIRFGSTASVDANPDVYFDGAMIEAEFAPQVAHSRRITIIQ